MSQALEVRRGWIESEHRELSIVEQCALAGLARSTYYYAAVQKSAENLKLVRVIDELYFKRPFYGSPRISGWLSEPGWVVTAGEKGYPGYGPGPRSWLINDPGAKF